MFITTDFLQDLYSKTNKILNNDTFYNLLRDYYNYLSSTDYHVCLQWLRGLLNTIATMKVIYCVYLTLLCYTQLLIWVETMVLWKIFRVVNNITLHVNIHTYIFNSVLISYWRHCRKFVMNNSASGTRICIKK